MPKEPFCKNCLLYDFEKRHCKVVVLYEGQRMHPPTEPSDHCIFDEEFISIDENGNKEKWKPEVQEVKWWVEDPATGQKSDKGIVKIEFPDSFLPENKF